LTFQNFVRMNRLLLSIAFSLLLYPVFAQGPAVLSVREQAAVVDGWLEDRIQQVLPALMTETDIDMWIVVSREYNEDPVIRTLLPATWHAARRPMLLRVTMWANPLRKLGIPKPNQISGRHYLRLLRPRSQRNLGLIFPKIMVMRTG
jgi:hypothetical protein